MAEGAVVPLPLQRLSAHQSLHRRGLGVLRHMSHGGFQQPRPFLYSGPTDGLHEGTGVSQGRHPLPQISVRRDIYLPEVRVTVSVPARTAEAFYRLACPRLPPHLDVSLSVSPDGLALEQIPFLLAVFALVVEGLEGVVVKGCPICFQGGR